MKRFFAIILTAVLLASVSVNAFAEEEKVLHWYIDGEITTMDSGKTYDILSREAVAYFADTLYRLDENAEPIPNLAVALPEISEDGLYQPIKDVLVDSGEAKKVRTQIDPHAGSCKWSQHLRPHEFPVFCFRQSRSIRFARHSEHG